MMSPPPGDADDSHSCVPPDVEISLTDTATSLSGNGSCNHPSLPTDIESPAPADQKQTCTLHTFPLEIRWEIYKYLFDEEGLAGKIWNGKVPAIIKALRLDNKLYQEALGIFFPPPQTYFLTHRNRFSFGDMAMEGTATINYAKIEIPLQIEHHEYPFHLPPILRKAVNLAELTMEVLDGRGAFLFLDREDDLGVLLGALKRLRRVTLSVAPVFPTQYQLGPKSYPEFGVERVGAIELLNHIFGTVGRLTRVPAYVDNTRTRRIRHILNCSGASYVGEDIEDYYEYVKVSYGGYMPWEGDREEGFGTVRETWFWEAGDGHFLNEEGRTVDETSDSGGD